MTLLVKVSLTLSIVANFRDSTLTYAQESIFSPTNHTAIVWLADQSQRYCVAVLPSVVTKFGQHFRHSQKAHTSPQRQRPTQYAHTGDFTTGAAHSRPPAYYTGLTPGIILFVCMSVCLLLITRNREERLSPNFHGRTRVYSKKWFLVQKWRSLVWAIKMAFFVSRGTDRPAMRHSLQADWALLLSLL